MTITTTDLFTTDPELADALTGHGEVTLRTKPTTKEIARSVNLQGQPVQAGERVPFFDGVEVQYHVVTKGEMVKVDRFRARADKQRQHSADELARYDLAQERERTAARRAEAVRRQAAASDAMRAILKASTTK